MTGFSVSITIVDDDVPEVNETFFVALITTDLYDYYFNFEYATVIILDDDGEYIPFTIKFFYTITWTRELLSRVMHTFSDVWP